MLERAYDVARIRAQFPILRQQVCGRPLAYLDNAATTQKPICVIETLEEVVNTLNANIHRGVHTLSRAMTERYEQARATVAAYLHVDNPKDVVFTAGATDGLNLIANCLPACCCRPGDKVVVSELEHHSNLVSWQLAAERQGLQVVEWPMHDDGTLDPKDLEALLDDRVKIVTMTQLSNTLGTLTPVEEVAELLHTKGIYLVVDGAQGVKHGVIDLPALGCDFYAFSSHKIYGPTGVGALWGRHELLAKMPPYRGGGEMVGTVKFSGTTYAEPPFRFEAGTPAYIQAVGLAKALEFYQSIDSQAATAHENELIRLAHDLVADIPGIEFYGYHESNAGILSFNVKGLHHFDVGTLLDKMGVAVRTGTHCTEPLLAHYGITGTVRVSLACYSTEAEVRQFAEALHRAVEMLR